MGMHGGKQRMPAGKRHGFRAGCAYSQVQCAVEDGIGLIAGLGAVHTAGIEQQLAVIIDLIHQSVPSLYAIVMELVEALAASFALNGTVPSTSIVSGSFTLALVAPDGTVIVTSGGMASGPARTWIMVL